MVRARQIGTLLSKARIRERAGPGPAPSRPDAALVWFHAATAPQADVTRHLAEGLAQARPELGALLTGEAETLAGLATLREPQPAPLPDPAAGSVQAFLDHWQPDLCVWTGGTLRPDLLNAAHRRGVRLLLVDADAKLLGRPGWRLLPSATRSALRKFGTILARDAETEAFLRRRMGLRDVRIEVTGPLYGLSRPLPHNESERQELAALLRGRPVWLAAHLRRDEIAPVLEANAVIGRLSHRLMLILAPADPADTDAFHDALRARELRYVTWSQGAPPGETTQAILADTVGEMGLWYRIAPVSFMGGSLTPDGGGSDPNEPAAHGSAILYGPGIRNHLDTYSRFAEAGGARIVHNAETLAAAVQGLLAPDQSAAMAHAAWDIATRGAAVMDRVVDLIHDELDRRSAG